MDLKITAAEMTALAEREFPQVSGEFEIIDLRPMEIDMRLLVQDRHLRPGGTVSGPAMFSLADCAFYYVTMAMIGPEALTVTTNCSMDFMRKPAAGRDIICKARLLKLGKSLSVGDCLLFSEGEDKPVARGNFTYSIPPKG